MSEVLPTDDKASDITLMSTQGRPTFPHEVDCKGRAAFDQYLIQLDDYTKTRPDKLSLAFQSLREVSHTDAASYRDALSATAVAVEAVLQGFSAAHHTLLRAQPSSPELGMLPRGFASEHQSIDQFPHTTLALLTSPPEYEFECEHCAELAYDPEELKKVSDKLFEFTQDSIRASAAKLEELAEEQNTQLSMSKRTDLAQDIRRKFDEFAKQATAAQSTSMREYGGPHPGFEEWFDKLERGTSHSDWVFPKKLAALGRRINRPGSQSAHEEDMSAASVPELGQTSSSDSEEE